MDDKVVGVISINFNKKIVYMPTKKNWERNSFFNYLSRIRTKFFRKPIFENKFLTKLILAISEFVIANGLKTFKIKSI